MWLLILILLVFTISATTAVILMCITEKDQLAKWLFACVIIETIVLILYMIEANKPQAIDVYRNITTLEITYKDNIPVESVVVFK